MSQRAFYSIDENVLDDFNRLVPAPKRSKIIENLMAQHVARQAKAIENAARMIEADPSFREVMKDAATFADDVLKQMRDE